MNLVFFKSKDEKIFDHLSNYKVRSDEEVHQFASKMKMQPNEMEYHIYRILQTFLTGGLANKKGITEKDVDPKQLAMGIKVEQEHIDAKGPCAPMIAKRIALDHLAEFPTYYTALAKMEKELSKGERT